MDGVSYTPEELTFKRNPPKVIHTDGDFQIRVALSDGGILFVDMDMDYSKFNKSWYRHLIHCLAQLNETARNDGFLFMHCVADRSQIKFCEMFGFEPIVTLTNAEDKKEALIFRRKVT